MLLAQITDSHLSAGGPGPAGIDGGVRLMQALAAAGAWVPRPAGIVLSGDLVERGEPEEYARLAAILRTSRIPVWPMTGNHDDRGLFARTFADCAPASDGRHRYVVERDGLRLVLLDSLDPGLASGRLGEAQLGWLDDVLGTVPERPAVVFVHHPPPTTGLAHVDRSALADADALAEVVARHPCVVRVACGHLHAEMATRWAGTTLTACPSVAHRIALDLRAEGRIAARPGPGAFQIHRWHAGMLHTYTVALEEEAAP